MPRSTVLTPAPRPARAGRPVALLALLVLSLTAFATPPSGSAAAAAAPAAEQPAAGTGTGTPLPGVSAPLPATPTSYPFGAANHQRVPEDLSLYGYVEEELLVSGTANVYDWPAPGPAVVRTAGAPYTTRVLVRRPVDRARFSGNVVVEMLNPSNLFDLNIGWALSHEQFLRNGDVWVGITAKPVAVQALKTFDPQRYGSLSMANPLPLSDPRNCAEPNTLIAGDSSRSTENGLIWDIYSQVGTWVRSSAASNPLTYGASAQTRTPVQHVYGFGYSQTGGYLYTYINAIAPLDVRANGRPTYDGYVIGVAGGAFAGTVPINQCAASIPVGDPRNTIHNAGVPVINIMSQSDYLIGIASRRPDSDVPGDQFRHYEVPGMGHATPDELYFSAAPEDIVKAGRTIPSLTCDQGPRSRFPSKLVFDAALQNLDLWVRKGIAPPHAANITVRGGKGAVDRFGNLLGGYRTPLLDVPTSTWSGSSAGAGFCFIVGHEEPFSTALLRTLYNNHGDYVRQVTQDVKRLVDARLLTAADGDWLITVARLSQVPRSPAYPISWPFA